MNNITLSNFKGYVEPTTIELSDITVNVGMNSVGKSTVVQALLLVRQTYEEILKYLEYAGANARSSSILIALNGSYDLQLGTFEQVSSEDVEDFEIKIGDNSFLFQRSDDRYQVKFTFEGNYIFGDSPVFSKYFYYLNSERLGPRNYQNVCGIDNSMCGYHGEHTFDIIERFRNDIIDESRRRAGADYSVSILSKQIEYWMDYIVPGIEFRTNEDTETRTAKLQIRQTTLDTDFNSPYNFGFGISYILPIIVTGLLAKPGSAIIVENPEAHLHPCGQSHLGQFLAQIAFSGSPVIIETHSEHLLNGIRLYALKNRISPDRLAINNFSIVDKTPQVERLYLNERMDILKWPTGFFDQEEKDLSELRRLRRMQ